MNSMSRGYNDCNRREREDEKKCPTIIKCGCPSSTQILVTAAAPTATEVVTSVNVDNSCICDPITKLEFATIISTVANGFAGTVIIRVFKQCERRITRVNVGPVWTLNIAANSTVPLSFFVCDSDSRENDGCTYTVEATITANASGSGIVTFNNATLGAISTCKNSCHKCRRDEDR
ncbi:MAG: DUF4489 domain-containing protein [Clostridium sp.]|uniref:DUF4489 domain-containing protein n=1 Tax=Clostridium sp. TaxID=1506 RepID=UPI00290C4608|nr:DUF4489 domain-containing protein [Clostridium sp.]MDU5109342.1 DUF4489 domain-containing protein [Clostridium sp.]